jgi:uncharacterized protein involved in exopolysaccharide biosynthesis
MAEKQEGFQFSSVDLIGFIIKWYKQIITVSLIVGVSSAALSLFIKDKYKSTVVLFPATTASISKTLLDVKGGKEDFLEFGKEDEAEQMLQILYSDEIKNKIIEEFDLMSHYKIDPNSKFAKTKLSEKITKNINFKRTEYLSVRIDVMDENPEMAANIANKIAAYVDSVKNRMQKERAVEGLAIVEAEYLDLASYISEMEDSLSKIRKLGINDYSSMSEVINKEYATALAKNDTRAIAALEKKLELLSEYGGAYISLTENLNLFREQLALLKTKYKEAQVNANQTISHKFIVNSATPAEKKTYPRRSLIVLFSTAAAFFLSIFVIIGIENFRKYKISLASEK